MVAAPVGWQCPECTSEGAWRSRQVPAFTHTSPGRTGAVGSTNPTPVVLVIIAINVVVFFLEDFGNNLRVVDRYAMWPAAVHQQHEYYRAFTAIWLHANFLHIVFNMIALLIVGPAVEVLLGKARFLALYLIVGLGGASVPTCSASPTWPVSEPRAPSWVSWAPTWCSGRVATCPWPRWWGCWCSIS